MRLLLGPTCWVIFVVAVVPTVVPVQSFAVERRRSVLLPWNDKANDKAPSSSARPILGWTLEERDESIWKVTVAARVGDDDEDGDRVTVELPWKGALRVGEEEEDAAAAALFQPDDLANSQWPAGIASAILIRRFGDKLLNNNNNNNNNHTVLELGSGLGLAGWVAGATAQSVVLTDHDEGAILRLKKTVGRNNDRLGDGANCTVRYLEWRDDHHDAASPRFDLILGSDVTYYYYLLRPLMDTIKAFLAETAGRLLVVGQANRQSQWDLYDNLISGCYNQLTDEREPPWDGRTRMLLYRLQLNEWTSGEETSDDEADRVDTVIPIAVLLHERDPTFDFLSEFDDHVATAKEQVEMLISF